MGRPHIESSQLQGWYFVTQRLSSIPAVVVVVFAMGGCLSRSEDDGASPAAGESSSDAATGLSDSEAIGPESSGRETAGAEAGVRIASAFWAKSHTPEGEVNVPILDREILVSGTEIAWKIETSVPTYVYVIYRDARDQVTVLYPLDDGSTAAQGIFEILPGGTKLNQETGLERFNLLASPTKLEPLASRIAEYRAASDEDCELQKDRLLEAVLVLRKQHEDVASLAARPTRIGGTVRGDSDQAIEYTANKVLSLAFTIDHR